MCRTPGPSGIDLVGAVLSVLGMGGIVLGILVWQEGGEAVGALCRGRRRRRSPARRGGWSGASAQGKLTLLDPDLFRSPIFRLGISGQMLQQIALGGAMIALPIFLQMVLEYNALQAGLSLAPLSLSMFVVAMLAGKRAGRPPAGEHHPRGLRPARRSGIAGAASRSCRARTPACGSRSRSLIAGSGLGLLVSQLNNYTLAPISEERISEAAGVNSAGGSFGLSFGLALAGGAHAGTLAFTFTNLAESSAVLSPGPRRSRSRPALDEDAQLMTNTQLDALIVGQPADVEAEIIRINTEARPIALQVALLVPLFAGLLGTLASFGMMRQKDVKPSAAVEGMAFG